MQRTSFATYAGARCLIPLLMGVIGSVVMLDPSMVVTGFTGIAAIAMGVEIVLTAGVAMLVSLFTSVDSEENPNSYLAIIVVNGVLLYVFNPVTKPVPA